MQLVIGPSTSICASTSSARTPNLFAQLHDIVGVALERRTRILGVVGEL